MNPITSNGITRRQFVTTVLAAAGALAAGSALTGCSSTSNSTVSALTTLRVAASPTPHAEILAHIKDTLTAQGVDLQVTEFTDYVQPNNVVQNNEQDANYFQHLPYLKNFNEQNGTDIVAVAKIHFETMSIFAGKTKSLDALVNGAKVAVPNDATNEARALLLLQDQGLITLNDSTDLESTPNDIKENPKGLVFVEVEAAATARELQDNDIAVVNGNYALSAGLTTADVLASESATSRAADTYANIVAVKRGRENDDAITKLVVALKSDDTKQWITDTYNGAVLPVDFDDLT
jgi:D-methionine transport system substrate-binding protein